MEPKLNYVVPKTRITDQCLEQKNLRHIVLLKYILTFLVIIIIIIIIAAAAVTLSNFIPDRKVRA
jgi:hypothetical protein